MNNWILTRRTGCSVRVPLAEVLVFVVVGGIGFPLGRHSNKVMSLEVRKVHVILHSKTNKWRNCGNVVSHHRKKWKKIILFLLFLWIWQWCSCTKSSNLDLNHPLLEIITFYRPNSVPLNKQKWLNFPGFMPFHPACKTRNLTSCIVVKGVFKDKMTQCPFYHCSQITQSWSAPWTADFNSTSPSMVRQRILSYIYKCFIKPQK